MLSFFAITMVMAYFAITSVMSQYAVSHHLLVQFLTTENNYMPHRQTLTAIFDEPMREDILCEDIISLIREIGSLLAEVETLVEANKERGYWLIAMTFGENTPRIGVFPRQKYASAELVSYLRETFDFFGIMPENFPPKAA